jgi:CRP-like cAMP-binding protein
MPNPTDDQVASVAIFSRLAPEDRALIAAVADLRTFSKGDVVFTEGEPANVILTILSGRIHVSSAAGRALDLPEVLDAGDPLGDVGAFEGGPYPATGRAMTTTRCLVIPRAELFRLFEQSPTLVRGFIHGLTHRIVELTRELRQKS